MTLIEMSQLDMSYQKLSSRIMCFTLPNLRMISTVSHLFECVLFEIVAAAFNSLAA